MTADADSEVKTSQAASQTAAGQSGAQSGASQMGAQTGGAQAGAGAEGRMAQAESVSDISQSEAYMVNLKRLVDVGINLDAAMQQVSSGIAQRVAKQALDFDQEVKAIALQNLQLGQTALANAVSLSNRINNNAETHDKQMDACSTSERERTVRVGDVSNTVQQAALSDNPVLQDAAIAAMVRDIVSQYVQNNAKS